MYIIFVSISVSHEGSVTFIFTLYFHFLLNVYLNKLPSFLKIISSLFKSIISQEYLKSLLLIVFCAENVNLSHKKPSSIDDLIVAIGLCILIIKVFSISFNSLVFNFKVTVNSHSPP